MIRLGSLAGYPFEGPRVLAGWSPPAAAAVFAVMCKPDPARERFAVIYVGQAQDLAASGLPFRHPASRSWERRAGNRFGLYIATYQPPGGAAPHRAEIVRELVAAYRPSCNDEQFERAWKDEWIGDYSAPGTTGPLTTRREPT